MSNLLKETIEYLKRNNKTPSDVLWCGNTEFYFSWEVFTEMANKEYNDGYGGNNVPLELKIVGKDFWLERHEYDGSEWWEYKELPMKPELNSAPNDLFCGSCDLEPQDKKGEG
jgi:hypothetical protein